MLRALALALLLSACSLADSGPTCEEAAEAFMGNGCENPFLTKDWMLAACEMARSGCADDGAAWRECTAAADCDDGRGDCECDGSR
jgi:hypothetical protein